MADEKFTLKKPQSAYFFGALLVDVIGESHHLGGAPFNCAYYLHHLGSPTQLISKIGNDPSGQWIASELGRLKMNTRWVEVDTQHPTGKVIVHLDKPERDRFEVTPQVAYDFIEKTPPKLVDSVIYFGTSCQRSAQTRATLEAFLKGNQEQDIFCDLNLRPPLYSKEMIEKAFKFSNHLKLNEDELFESAQILTGSAQEEPPWVHTLLEHYNIENVFITRAERGATWYSKYNKGKVDAGAVSVDVPISMVRTTDDIVHTACDMVHTPEDVIETVDDTVHTLEDVVESTEGWLQSSKNPVPSLQDTVGAGDAFSAALIHAMILQTPPRQALERACNLASRVCRVSGALLPADQIHF